ncbi:MAG: hypothetical protein GAK34_00588 [Delftia tsuruhatensis]|nr:MAG: hypothetical protein GAK34_00588 [Delftia tsuruhatensis]
MGAQLRIRHEGGGQPRQRLVARALGYEVDRAAHRAAGRHAVEQGRGALEHVHALEHFWRCAVERRHAEQPAKRDIADAGAEAANGVVLADDAGHARAEHGGVGGGDHVGDVAGLAVGDEFLGIADGVEGRLHEVLVAQQAHAAACGDLAAGIGFRRLLSLCAHGDGRHEHAAVHGRCRVAVAAQGVAAVGFAQGAQALAAQQLGKAFGHAVAARQACAAAALQQAGIHRQLHAGRCGKGVERLAQRAGRDAEGAAGLAGCRPGGGSRCGPLGSRLRQRGRHGHGQASQCQARHAEHVHGDGRVPAGKGRVRQGARCAVVRGTGWMA